MVNNNSCNYYYKIYNRRACRGLSSSKHKKIGSILSILPHEKQIIEYEQTLEKLKEQSEPHSLLPQEEVKKLEKRKRKLQFHIGG